MQSKNVKMEEDGKSLLKQLEQHSYRFIQQLAKSLGLPSNFKRVYLVELIHAKKHKSETEVCNIIHRVKLERLLLSKSKRDDEIKRMQNTELPSSKIPFSPPIKQTPKRPSHIRLLCSPESSRRLNTHKPKKKLIHTLNQNGLYSDRVLRSFNMKSVKPNYALLSGQEIKCHSPKETRIEINTNGGHAKCVINKHIPNILNSSLKRPLMLDDESDLLSKPTKCQKTLTNLCASGTIVPDTISESTNRSQNILFCKNCDGIENVKDVIRKPHIVPKPETSFRNSEANTQNVKITINDDNNLTESNGNNNYLQINDPNVSSENDNMNAKFCDHEKKSSEQNCKEMERLPTISEVFSRFNNINRTDLSQPLYVQVTTESERSQSYPVFSNGNQCSKIILETLYNFKSNNTNEYLLQMSKTSDTKCVVSSHTMTSSKEQSSTIVPKECYVSYDTSHEGDPLLHGFPQFPVQNARTNDEQGDFNVSTAFLETSQDLGTATLPEMEDALELISQDGDYMDPIAMERLQCVFCSWAGPKIILENHIRKEHGPHIERQSASTWSVTCSLESISTTALLRVVEHKAALYLFRSVYEDTDCLVATLNSLSIETEAKIGSITIYNRISGEPFIWSGQIQPVSPDFDCKNDNCLQIEVSKLDLLPNSANLKFLNRELVLASDSPNKAVVGQPSLADMHLLFLVQIFD